MSGYRDSGRGGLSSRSPTASWVPLLRSSAVATTLGRNEESAVATSAVTHPSQTPGSLGGYCAQTSVECAATPLLLKNNLAQLPQWVAICS
jgi:hypothetical protein